MLRRKAPRVEAEFIKFRMAVGDPVGYGPEKEHGTYVVEFRTAAGEQRARAYYDALQTESASTQSMTGLRTVALSGKEPLYVLKIQIRAYW